MCVCEENARIATQENAIEDICTALKTHGNSSAAVTEHASSAIWCLSLNENQRQQEYLVEQGICLVMNALKNFHGKIPVTKSCFIPRYSFYFFIRQIIFVQLSKFVMALASVAGSSDEGSVRVMDPEMTGSRDGLAECLTAYQIFLTGNESYSNNFPYFCQILFIKHLQETSRSVKIFLCYLQN